MESSSQRTQATSGLSSEEIERSMRLEAVFLPHTRQKREKIYIEQNGSVDSTEPIRFAHYTSADAALRIIQTKRMWMRNTICMSDYREVQHGYDLMRNFFSDEAKLNAFVGALDAPVPGAAKEAIKWFDSWYAPGAPHSINLNTYIASVSEHPKEEDEHGRLSMWRAFGGNTARVAIVFSVPRYATATQALSVLFSPVSYPTPAEADVLLHQVIHNIGAEHAFLANLDRQWVIHALCAMFLVNVTCLKHRAFREEREWRVIYTPKIQTSPLVELSTEVIGGIPQPIHKLPFDESLSQSLSELDFPQLFDRLIIGPSAYPWAMYEAFADALRKSGVPNANERVFSSNIPIRT